MKAMYFAMAVLLPHPLNRHHRPHHPHHYIAGKVLPVAAFEHRL